MKIFTTLALIACMVVGINALPKPRGDTISKSTRSEESTDAALYGPVDWDKKKRGDDSTDAALYGPVDWDKKKRGDDSTDAALYGPVDWD
ncbi:uncharacterized protein N7477_000418 [Penicillium maclennaniae]|uniref:uncharacterized protein n=1 Tax=Penicillium maclennaniae TaxID=1343394 RepID=UPI00254194DD|nr:uncharacterized protein N7477_000418 [Penicillium maclennaniae]KAJ5684073.1 hypothetical protein N7477_000418 [Penicillium maclennaniae]